MRPLYQIVAEDGVAGKAAAEHPREKSPRRRSLAKIAGLAREVLVHVGNAWVYGSTPVGSPKSLEKRVAVALGRLVVILGWIIEYPVSTDACRWDAATGRFNGCARVPAMPLRGAVTAAACRRPA